MGKHKLSHLLTCITLASGQPESGGPEYAGPNISRWNMQSLEMQALYNEVPFTMDGTCANTLRIRDWNVSDYVNV